MFLSRRSHTNWIAVCLSMLVINGLAQMQVLGQQPGEPPKKQNKDLPENHAEKLKDFIETPGVPKYQGKCYFEQGVVFREALSGPSITMKFVVRDRPPKVLAWYKQVFEQGKWQIETTTTDPTRRIGATKDKNICRVLVDNCPDPLFPTRVTLTYRLYKPAG